MKRYGFLIVCLFLAVSLLSARESRPRVALQRPSSPEGNIQLNAIASTMFDTSELILSMLNQYDLVLDDTGRVGDITAYTESHNVDNFISGSCTLNEEGEIELSLYAYGRGQGRILEEKRETVESVLDVFDVVDAMVIDLLSGFSGRHIAFGDLVLVNDGVPGRYRFLLDGKEYPVEEGRADRILIGTHTVKIEQDRLEGLFTVSEQSVEVVENEATALHFSVPGILDGEAALLTGAEAPIDRYWSKERKSRKVDEAFGELMTMLEDVSYSSGMLNYKETVSSRLDEWEALKYQRRTADPFANRKGRMILSLGFDLLADGTFSMDDPDDYQENETVGFNQDAAFFLPEAEIQYFVGDRHSLLARVGIIGGEGYVNPETPANSEGEPSLIGQSEGGFDLTLGYEYYFKRLFVGCHASARAMDVQWESGSESVEIPDEDVYFRFNLEPKLGFLFNQKAKWVYKVFIAAGPSLLVMNGQKTKVSPLNGVRIGISAGYGGIRF